MIALHPKPQPMLRAPLPVTALLLTLTLGLATADARVKDEPVDGPHRITDDLILKTMDGEDYRLSELRGHRVLLVTWASW